MSQEGIRLQRYLSQSGVASRRRAEEMITAGEVRVNGRVVTELGTRVIVDHDQVVVAGQHVRPQDLVYLVLNKPKGFVTTVSDPEGRATVMELLEKNLPSHVVPVGRLDFYTEGVLLFTNDGDLAAGLLAPRSHVEKTYHVKLRGSVTEDQLEKLRTGVWLIDDSRKTMAAQVDMLKFTGTHTWLVMTIREGRTRQIHRMMEALGLTVLKLARVAFGGITFFGLKVGQSRRLTPGEVHSLRELAGVGDKPMGRVGGSGGAVHEGIPGRDAWRQEGAKRRAAPRREGAAAARREGAGPRREGPGPRREGPGPRREGPGPRREGPGPRREGPGPRREGPGPRRDGPGPRREGPGPRREGPGPRREGPGPRRQGGFQRAGGPRHRPRS